MNLKQLVEFIAKTLADDPSQVQVNIIEGRASVTVELHVAKDDVGRMIGKSGRIVNSVRTLVRAAMRQGKRAFEIV
jgi:predicted RNA-binding protein YlqC (UPF0109 family)